MIFGPILYHSKGFQHTDSSPVFTEAKCPPISSLITSVARRSI
jgi:hypothetical protein